MGMRAGVVAVLFGIAPGFAVAQAPGSATGGSEPAKDQGGRGADAMVLSKMHQTNQMEIEAGQMAMKRATADSVRGYGEVLVRDHRMADKMVEGFAKEHGVELAAPTPSSPQDAAQMKQQMSAMDQVKSANVRDFDRMFLATMVAGHEKAISMLEGAEQRVSPDLASMLRKMVPILKQHLELAQHLRHEAQPSS